MEAEKSTGKPRKRIRKMVLFGVLSLLVIFYVGDWIWYKSGSNEWKLARDRDGIKIWTLKTSGSRITKIKLRMQLKSKLASMIKLIEDPASGPDVGAKEVNMLEMKVSPAGDFSAYYECKIDLPFPFKDRQSVILILHSQDSISKKIEMNIFAAPNKLPPDDSYVRPTHMHNIWYLTPLENGLIDIEYYQDSDIGGSVPYFVNNVIAIEALFELFRKFQHFMDLEKFKDAKFHYVKELEMSYNTADRSNDYY
jgi:hypothetical protein